MLLRGIGALEAKLSGNVSSCWWITRLVQIRLDERQYFSLSWGQLGGAF